MISTRPIYPPTKYERITSVLALTMHELERRLELLYKTIQYNPSADHSLLHDIEMMRTEIVLCDEQCFELYGEQS